MKLSANNLIFDGESKEEVRSFIAKYAKKSKSYLDFYGNGTMYNLVKRKTKTHVVSIDSDPKIKSYLNHKDTLFIDLKSFCNTYSKKFDCIWLDYCGQFSQSKLEDIEELAKIMAPKGYLFLTFFMGRENHVPKGTIRKVLEYGCIATIEEIFKEENIKINLFYRTKYRTIPSYIKKKRLKKQPSAMQVFGFEWNSKSKRKKIK